ncbi:hypothetical protein [Psychroserpens ponticola]|uniref:Uncharacterized protein n=1 Tax=Psychroserpens ponticola TaxID=2932268 RepID=A0ABY7RY96_9FLAO|nr:hypothetical protein [Psychroserpens ponticola]WCO01727.1 hypothetical protein MUN68_016910 [Psychroserpens ponticola]
MNYYYLLFALSFIIFGIHNSISSRIKDGEMLATGSFLSNLMLRATPWIGYIVLAINLYYSFYWIYSVLIFFVGLLIVPAVTIKILSLVTPSGVLKYIINPYPKTIIAYIALSILIIVLLLISI